MVMPLDFVGGEFKTWLRGLPFYGQSKNENKWPLKRHQLKDNMNGCSTRNNY
jgi:hypothetical protein